MFPRRIKTSYGKLALVALLAGLVTTGCGQQYVMLHPAGPVGRSEMHLMVMAAIAMGIVILIVFVLFFYAVIRFRDTPGNTAPYRPDWHSHKVLETIWWILPAVLLTIIAIPTVKTIYALDRVPKASDPIVVDVTSLTWKWLFEYPGQHVATVNYLEIPKGVPVLFELTANSPMNTFWIPQLGGMEYTMPNRVLPLWLEADKTGTYWGDSGQYSGTGFAKMFFTVKVVSPTAFRQWAAHVRQVDAPMTTATYEKLLRHNTMSVAFYGSYPKSTFPTVANGFTLTGSGMYMVMRDKNQIEYMPMTADRP